MFPVGFDDDALCAACAIDQAYVLSTMAQEWRDQYGHLLLNLDAGEPGDDF